MSKFHVYIKPFDTLGNYESEFTEVTDDVDFKGLGTLTQQLDNTEYDVGVFRNSNLRLKMRNDHGLYSDSDNIESLFKYKRSDSIVKITWEPGDHPLIAGFFTPGPGAILSAEVDIFKGFLDDKSTKTDADKQDVNFSIMGQEVLFERVTVPYASISNGDLFSEAFYTMLNQSTITDHLTVSSGNISCSVDVAIDDKSKLENKTVHEALRDMLLASNSVLYIQDDTVYIKPRTEGASTAFTFYGQGSDSGAENILELRNYRTGSHRIFNFVTWKDASLSASDSSSITKYGTIKKEVSLDLITNSSKRQSIIDDIRDEFKNPKKEFDVSTPLNVDSLGVFLLNKVTVDNPALVVANENDSIAIYGIAEYGADVYPEEISTIVIPSTDDFKVMSRKINFGQETIEFSVREV